MNIHEYQAKAVLKEFGVPVPRGLPAFSVEDAVGAAQELGGPVWVVKAQIHAGGRGKGGGVKVVKSLDDVRKEAERMLGMTLITPSRPRPARAGWCAASISRRARPSPANCICPCWSTARPRAWPLSPPPKAGMDIEEAGPFDAGKDRHLLHRSGHRRVFAHHGRHLIETLKLEGPAAKQAAALLRNRSTPPSSRRTWPCWRSTP